MREIKGSRVFLATLREGWTEKANERETAFCGWVDFRMQEEECWRK